MKSLINDFGSAFKFSLGLCAVLFLFFVIYTLNNIPPLSNSDGCRLSDYECSCKLDCEKSKGEFVRYLSSSGAGHHCICQINKEIKNIW